MKKIIIITFIALGAISCTSPKKGNMTVTGTINGLKKGTLYLQKYKDTVLITVDSITLDGENSFTLIDDVKSPEMYQISLEKNATKVIMFFAEKGNITINSKLDKFTYAAKISGSKNQELLEQYHKMLSKFNEKKLNLIKNKFLAQKENLSDSIKKIEAEELKLLKRQYLYTANYAVNNSNYEIAPYLALTQLTYANINLLDTINKSLSKEVKKSVYGQQLERLLKENKK